ncbi:MAG: type IX secretion system sortase PorU, partial [Bacteroidia bacterium]|nr:type IX secretion system sortase PorU [Bacteroidia bacterium]
MTRKALIIYALAICCSFNLSAQQRTSSNSFNLNWKESAEKQVFNPNNEPQIMFDGARISAELADLPIFVKKWKVGNGYSELNTSIKNIQTERLSENLNQKQKNLITSDFKVKSYIIQSRREKWAVVEITTLRKSNRTGSVEKLMSFELDHQFSSTAQRSGSAAFVNNSVLNSGTWYKVAVTSTGIHKLSANYFSSQLGIPLNTINPQNIRIYGNGGGMVPVLNSDARHDDLVENAIMVVGESDGVFHQNDYVLFYAEQSDEWVYNATDELFEHVNHLYSDSTYYFINVDLGPGKRVTSRVSSTQTPTVTVQSFNDYKVHETDEINFIKSGRNWYGETFSDIQSTRFFAFDFPNIVTTEPVNVWSRVAARSFSTSSFSLRYNSNLIASQGIAATTSNYLDYFAKINVASETFNASASPITLELKYNFPNPSSTGYLDKLVLNARRQLVMNGNHMLFRDARTATAGSIAKFEISSTNQQSIIWDVTDPLNAISQEHNFNNGVSDFVMDNSALNEYVIFSGENFPSPKFRSRVNNQDLHGLGDHDYVIISHPLFLPQANRLADIHRTLDNMDVAVVTTDEVFNEFSSGAVDVAAIRDFLRMFYERAALPEDIVKYVCLFGDGSYDNRSLVTSNTNFVPTYQSRDSEYPIGSFVSDDFYVLLDPVEGVWSSSNNTEALDMGIGRMPVKNVKEARIAIDKIETYLGISQNQAACGNDVSTNDILGDWRNVIMFVADDEDSNTHIRDADELTEKINISNPEYNIDKVYFDSFEQESNAGGQRFPEVTSAIKKRIEKGALFVNYTGHGGELGWAHEGVLTISDINGWNNPVRMPAFMTATCEFARYDDPARTSAGEITYLREGGGAIALLTTVRLVTSFANKQLNNVMYGHMFERIDGEMPRLGDIMRLTKNDYLVYNTRNFTLLGDPALKLAYPEFNVSTTEINDQPAASFADTLKAFSTVKIKGEVQDHNNQKMTNFNGVVYPSIFDKAATITTLSNDPSSPPFNFKLQRNVIYRGKASVTNGEFEFTFIIPKDISYVIGEGKISYYAHNDEIDASGYDTTILIGGISDSLLVDTEGPQ